MSSVMAALLLVGACGSASRTMVVEPSIESILIHVVVGGVKDVLAQRGTEAWLRLPDMQVPTLRIDGQPRTGVIAWLAAAHRVAGYAISRPEDREQAAKALGRTGSVEYSYRLRIRGLDVFRDTRIEDGRVLLVTDVYGRIGPKGELYRVRLCIDACEFRSRDGSGESVVSTRIVGTATGWSEIGKRCRLVSSIATRQIRLAMDRELLTRIQRGGIDLYRAGSIAEALK